MKYKCPNCGGELAFDPSSGKLKCPYCDSVFELEEQEKLQTQNKNDAVTLIDEEAEDQGVQADSSEKANDESEAQDGELVSCLCPNCGAKIVTAKTTASTSCPYCRTPLVIEEQTSGAFRPKYVIPFELDEKQIAQVYEDYIKTKPFYPEAYSKKNVIAKIRGVYLPYWLYDLGASGDMVAEGEKTLTRMEGKYQVTDHMVYHVFRQGHMDFWKIPVLAASNTKEEDMNALEPYDYKKLNTFNPGYLAGFLAQRYDQTAEERSGRCTQRAKKTLSHKLFETMPHYSGIHKIRENLQTQNKISDFVMLPVWILDMKYDKENGEDGLIAINGQSGKIAGNIPVDNKKMWMYFLKVLLITFAVVFIVAMAIFMFVDF